MLTTVRPIWSELDSVSLLKEEQRTPLKDFLPSWLAGQQSLYMIGPLWRSKSERQSNLIWSLLQPFVFEGGHVEDPIKQRQTFPRRLSIHVFAAIAAVLQSTQIQTHSKNWTDDQGHSAECTQGLPFCYLPWSVTHTLPPKCALIVCVWSEILLALSFYQARGVWKSLQSGASSGDKACGDKEGAPWWSTFRALTLPPRLIIIPPQSKAQ